ncbi:MAG TPA: alpha/beta fold hydrolase [Sedimentisphaerales bacterium]|nr:alpha/beta fold hydrolase [Sedimentisphaerales bacterium]
MNQIDFFDSNTNRLSCVCTIPDHHKIKAGVVFVHAADGNRLGPHRMFVELAERLKNIGIASLRFDMRGCGDSSGLHAGNNINPDIEDLLNAITFFTSKYNPPQIFLFAISRGARVSISALAKHSIPVSGAVLLSTPFAGSKAAAKNFFNRLKEYLYKLTNIENLKKLISGKAHLKQIAKTLAFALNSQKRYRTNTDEFVTRCPMFFIYGFKDPIAQDSSLHYSRICEKFNIPFKTAEIKKANHSFFHYHWKEQITEMTENWFMQNIQEENFYH